MPYECVYMPTVSAFFPWLTATLTGELEAAMNEVAMVQVLRLRTNPWWVHEVEYTKSSVNTSWVLQLYIHPHLEYAAPVWDLHQQGLINCLERLQKFAHKVCTNTWSSERESLLQSRNLPTLASRRHHCVFVNGHLNFSTAPIVPWNQISQKHQYTSPWKPMQ